MQSPGLGDTMAVSGSSSSGGGGTWECQATVGQPSMLPLYSGSAEEREETEGTRTGLTVGAGEDVTS